MRTSICRLLPALLGLAVAGLGAARAATGPFSPDNWPGGRDASKIVHYIATEEGLTPPSDKWVADELVILTGGDQNTVDFTIGGRKGKKATDNYLNVGDKSFDAWKDEEFIDILVQAYGDAALFNSAGNPRDFTFLTGTLPLVPGLSFPIGGQVPVEARNKKWNWILFRIPNNVRPADGARLVGSIPANAQGGTGYGGVNGGTIRFEGVLNLIVRVVAFGQQGAFGEPEDVNKFAPVDSCDPEPSTNLAGIDLAKGQTNHMQILNDNDQTVTVQGNVGPAGDKRRAVRPNGSFLNFGVTGTFLGQPCNDPRAVKIGVEFYDDPAFAGADVRFGPEAYATDDKGGTDTYPKDKRQLLTGSGTWIRRSWTVPAVSLKGINAGALTAGPRLISENGQVFVSAFFLGVLRTGTNALAGQDPLPDFFPDPAICTEAYGSFAELDLAKDVKNGLDVGSSGGDQEMIVAEAGPAKDRRQAIRPAREDGSPGFAHQFLNFAIRDEALGPSSQPPAHLAICVTYYDDPALAGKRFKPEAYRTERNGSEQFGFTADSAFVTLQGTDAWVDAYWEIPDVKFTGVNQGPQAAARFTLEDKIFLTRVRYAVIRPCGPNAGKNALAGCKPPPAAPAAIGVALGANKSVRISWPVAAAGLLLQSTPTLTAPQWQPVGATPAVEGDMNVVEVQPTTTTFYRLVGP